jgi:hypothetical protein
MHIENIGPRPAFQCKECGHQSLTVVKVTSLIKRYSRSLICRCGVEEIDGEGGPAASEEHEQEIEIEEWAILNPDSEWETGKFEMPDEDEVVYFEIYCNHCFRTSLPSDYDVTNKTTEICSSKIEARCSNSKCEAEVSKRYNKLVRKGIASIEGL